VAPGAKLPENGALLLGERARMLGLKRRGAVSANGSCRLLEAANGRVALNLPRDEDWELVPALLGELLLGEAGLGKAGDWTDLARIAATLSVDALLEQGRLLGLAIALDEAVPAPPEPFSIARLGAPRFCGGGAAGGGFFRALDWTVGGIAAGCCWGASSMAKVQASDVTAPLEAP
jgi:hypothetical protein